MAQRTKGWLLAGLATALVLLGGALWPLTLSDGTEKLKGVQLEVAQRAIEWDWEIDNLHLVKYYTKLQVTKVEPNADPSCNATPDERHYYQVTVRHVGMFGLTYEKDVYRGCLME